MNSNRFWNGFPEMTEALEKVSAIIREAAYSRNPVITEGMSGLLSGDGKMLRPALLLASARFGKVKEKHYNLAAAVEMLHTATLIHDDVIDDSPLRRGQPAVHARLGKRDAVLAGDFLFSRCFVLTAEFASPQNVRYLARLMEVICTMEIEQNSDRFKSNVSKRSYLRKIMGKSAVLFSLACLIGSHEAGAPKRVCEKLRRIGYNIGMSFQITDDMIDYAGKEETAGKPLGSDIAGGIITLPLLCALPLSPDLRAIFSQKTFKACDCRDVVNLVRQSGGVEAAGKHAKLYTDRALGGIQGLPKGRSRDLLASITLKLLSRES